MSTSPKITERRNNDRQINVSIYIYVCVNKAGKKRDFTFCGPAMGPDSESHYDEWWHSVTTEPSNQTSTASVCETLNLYKQEKPPSDPKIAILDWSSSSQRVTTQCHN